MAESTGAVFISYASQDAEAAQRICAALRTGGIEVWFDQSELRGGDVWDQRIRRQIHDCALFVAVTSANTAARHEGYFRLEWDLADQRTHMMARNRVFIMPVYIGATPMSGYDVPESFHRVQWTGLPGGETPPAFVERIGKLLSPEASAAWVAATAAPSGLATVGTSKKSVPGPWRSIAPLWAIGAVLTAALLYVAADRFWFASHSAKSRATENAIAIPGSPVAITTPFNPPPHSIAVLPFVNMSGDKEQEYFSDGLTEEVLNSLSRINELQVAGRTSSFYFKGEHADLPTIARKLNVASILEGSVRRSGQKVRVSAQLNNAVTGFQLWSQTYDRNLSDVLQLQEEIANAVTNALRVTLLSDTSAKIVLGGTHNPRAFDAYLRASKTFGMQHRSEDLQVAIASYDEAVRLDPEYALALADRAIALANYAQKVTEQARQDALGKARDDARKAMKLAPGLMEGHRALGIVLQYALDFGGAAREYERAMALNSGNARMLRIYGHFAVSMGWTDVGLAALRRGVALDPLSPYQHTLLADALNQARRYDESTAAYRDALTIDPDDSSSYVSIGANYFMLGNYQGARSWCEARPAYSFSSACLAVTYEKLGRHSDAEAALAKFRAATGDAYQYILAQIYSSWGDTGKALEYLEKTMRAREPALVGLKTEALLDPLRNEPRFQAIERELKFPN